MRVCYFGTYRASYVRNRLMIERLRSLDVEVVECQETLWRGIEDRERTAAGGWLLPGFWWRVVRAYIRLIWRYFRLGDYDVMVVGYPGQPDVPLARLLSRLRKKPLVWDVLMSIYLISLERGLDKRCPFTVGLIRRLERLACRMPDLLLIDTLEYTEWFQLNYGVTPERVRLLPLGADDRVFKPLLRPDRATGDLICLYYGTYLPSHGVRTIIEAARLLDSDPSIQFEMIGQGPERDEMFRLAKAYRLSKVNFIDWLPVEELVKRIAAADICLGTFGNTPQALMTMQNKIHEGLAMGKAVITGDSPVMRMTLRHEEHIYLCARERPTALAKAIRALRDNPKLRVKIARSGYDYYQTNLTFDAIGGRYLNYLEELLHERPHA